MQFFFELIDRLTSFCCPHEILTDALAGFPRNRHDEIIHTRQWKAVARVNSFDTLLHYVANGTIFEPCVAYRCFREKLSPVDQTRGNFNRIDGYFRCLVGPERDLRDECLEFACRNEGIPVRNVIAGARAGAAAQNESNSPAQPSQHDNDGLVL